MMRDVTFSRTNGIMPIVITGGAGFIGCNLAARLASEREHVLILDNLARPGVETNLEWLRDTFSQFVSFSQTDVRDSGSLTSLMGSAAGIFHFAAQVAVTSSISDPRSDLDVNLTGTFNVLEAARALPQPPPVVFASTNKVYGELASLEVEKHDKRYVPTDRHPARYGISELWPLSFYTPYGCSKGSADQYVLDYARMFDLRATVMRMSCIYGPRQCGNEDQGWVAHFAKHCLTDRPIQIFGDGCQVRDILHVDDAVEAYVRAFRNIERIRGRAFNLGGGPANAVSLLELINHIGELTDTTPHVDFRSWRPGDQRYFVSDRRLIDSELALPAPIDWKRGTADLVNWLRGCDTSSSDHAFENVFASCGPI